MKELETIRAALTKRLETCEGDLLTTLRANNYSGEAHQCKAALEKVQLAFRDLSVFERAVNSTIGWPS